MHIVKSWVVALSVSFLQVCDCSEWQLSVLHVEMCVAQQLLLSALPIKQKGGDILNFDFKCFAISHGKTRFQMNLTL
jgi:hypothetical protein